jgi:AraC-like DNA-binding protein
MKAYAEKLEFDRDSSLRSLNRTLDNGIPFQWHHHPVFELTLTLNSHGQRYIGDHVGTYSDKDLVLVGSNLPHTWYSQSKIDHEAPHTALVIWFRPEWAAQISATFAEFERLQHFLRRASGGLKFSNAAAELMTPTFQDFFSAPPRERLLLFFSIISGLLDDEGERLGSYDAAALSGKTDEARIDRILTHIHAHYAGNLQMSELADIAAISLSSLHRLFTKHTGMPVTEYIAQMRTGEACARLSGTLQPIAHIADAVGYGTIANFYRQFRSLKGMTPGEYRDLFCKT